MQAQDEPFRFPVSRFMSEAYTLYLGQFGPLFLGHLVVALILNLGGILALPVTGPLMAGLMYLALRAVRGHRITFEDTFSQFNRFMPTMLLGLVQVGIVTVSFILFGIPALVGMIWALFLGDPISFAGVFFIGSLFTLLPVAYVLLYFTPSWFFILDEGNDWMAALRKSRALVLRQRAAWIGLLVPVSLIHLAISLTCVGYFLVTPWLLLCFALAFDYQIWHEEGREESAPVPPELPERVQEPPE